MKKLFGLLFVSVFMLAACGSGSTPAEAPAPTDEASEPVPIRGTVEVAVGGSQVSVNYGRPELQGRDMISELPDGQVWRLGANEATALETSGALVFGETRIEAGHYSLWARKVSEQEWSLIFNSEPEIWGTNRKAENDVVEVPIEVSEGAEAVEQFTIEINAAEDGAAEMVMSWGMLELKAGFREAPEGS